jgi:hypothetical protein
MMKLFTLTHKLVRRMASVPAWKSSKKWRMSYYYLFNASYIERFKSRELNLHAMRSGPGKHLKGLTLMGGIVKPEEVNVFLCFKGNSPTLSCH